MSTKTAVVDQARELQPEIVELRRYLHEHPELSFAEFETAGLVSKRLSGLGYSVREKVGRTGVTADLGSGTMIAIRADMDALPIDEVTDASYISKNQGIMHACGHDAHVSIAMACAKLLAADRPDGRIRMLMQPAEEYGDDEGVSGAPRMIEDGALEGVSAAIGLHVDASLPAGKVGVIAGPTMAAVDEFIVTIKGRGGHGAYPEKTVDAVVLASHVVLAIQQIIARRVSALDSAVVTVGAIRSSSTRGNVIAEEVELTGTFRTFKQGVREVIMKELESACSVAKALGGDFSIRYDLGYPTTVNDPEITRIMHATAVELLGKENVIDIEPRTWSEDFSFFANKVPAAFMFLGVALDGDLRSHHSPNFDINESKLYVGAAVLAETARRLMTRE